MQHAIRLVTMCLGVAMLGSSPLARSAAGPWKPEKPVEIVAPSGAGGTTDRTARVVARILTQMKLVDVPVNVVNKPGGSGGAASTTALLGGHVTEDWKKDLVDNFWEDGYADAKAARRRLDEEYAEYKAILTELGVAK